MVRADSGGGGAWQGAKVQCCLAPCSNWPEQRCCKGPSIMCRESGSGTPFGLGVVAVQECAEAAGKAAAAASCFEHLCLRLFHIAKQKQACSPNVHKQAFLAEHVLSSCSSLPCTTAPAPPSHLAVTAPAADAVAQELQLTPPGDVSKVRLAVWLLAARPAGVMGVYLPCERSGGGSGGVLAGASGVDICSQRAPEVQPRVRAAITCGGE